MNILVTGGAGFIGSHIVHELLKKNHHVFVVDDLSTGKKNNLHPMAKFYRYDIRSSKMEKLFKKIKFDVVNHHAAQKNLRSSVQDPLNDADINIVGSLKLLELCRKYHVKKFIFASTGGALFDDSVTLPAREEERSIPKSPYGISKLCIEHYLEFYHRVYGLSYAALRYSNVYGGRQDPKGEAGVIAIFIKNMLREEPCTITGTGKQTRDFIHVSDVVKANMLAMHSSKTGSYHIGTGVETSILKLFETLSDLLGYNARPEFSKSVAGEVMRSVLSSQRAKKQLGWEAKTSLFVGLKKTIPWFLEQEKKLF
ncbi:MAG: NAD-dependent epimerase/dehydratase family protein [Parcubacteria group bacterium]|nr:NAD-dependent epimerase/dehydratase family protein [Parcubacteria group bacterium]